MQMPLFSLVIPRAEETAPNGRAVSGSVAIQAAFALMQEAEVPDQPRSAETLRWPVEPARKLAEAFEAPPAKKDLAAPEVFAPGQVSDRARTPLEPENGAGRYEALSQDAESSEKTAPFAPRTGKAIRSGSPPAVLPSVSAEGRYCPPPDAVKEHGRASDLRMSDEWAEGGKVLPPAGAVIEPPRQDQSIEGETHAEQALAHSATPIKTPEEVLPVVPPDKIAIGSAGSIPSGLPTAKAGATNDQWFGTMRQNVPAARPAQRHPAQPMVTADTPVQEAVPGASDVLPGETKLRATSAIPNPTSMIGGRADIPAGSAFGPGLVSPQPFAVPQSQVAPGPPLVAHESSEVEPDPLGKAALTDDKAAVRPGLPRGALGAFQGAVARRPRPDNFPTLPTADLRPEAEIGKTLAQSAATEALPPRQARTDVAGAPLLQANSQSEDNRIAAEEYPPAVRSARAKDEPTPASPASIAPPSGAGIREMTEARREIHSADADQHDPPARPRASSPAEILPRTEGQTAAVLSSAPAVVGSKEWRQGEAVERLELPEARMADLPVSDPRPALFGEDTQGNPGSARTELARGAAAQIAEVIRVTGEKGAEVRLNPEELGRVKVSMSHDGATLSVAVSAERPDTLDLIRRHIDLLADELRRMGYGSVNFSFDGGAERRGGQSAVPARPGDHLPTAAGTGSPTPAADLPEAVPRLPGHGHGGMDLRI